MDPVSILLTAGQFVPAILRWFGRDSAADVAGKVVEVTRQVTGRDAFDEGVAALKADPTLLLRYQEAVNALAMAEMEAETRRLEATNATMRAEYASNDPYVRRARPTFLYAMAATWTVQALGLLLAAVFKPALASDIIRAAGDLTAMWSVALAVVGVAIKARSDDKARAAGADAPSLATSILNALPRRAGAPVKP